MNTVQLVPFNSVNRAANLAEETHLKTCKSAQWPGTVRLVSLRDALLNVMCHYKSWLLQLLKPYSEAELLIHGSSSCHAPFCNWASNRQLGSSSFSSDMWSNCMSADAESMETGTNVPPIQGYGEILLQSIKSEPLSLLLAAFTSLWGFLQGDADILPPNTGIKVDTRSPA